MTSALLELHAADAPALLPVRSRPVLDSTARPAPRPTVTAADAAARQARAHAKLTARGWVPAGLPYDPAGPDAHVTVAQLLRDVADWRACGRETLFAAVPLPDGRDGIQAYTRPADPDEAQRELWQREWPRATALPFDLDAVHAAEGADLAHLYAEMEPA